MARILEEHEVYFMYSSMYYDQQQSIAGRCYKRFQCGQVPVKNSKCPYTNICDEDSLQSFCNMYPDASIVLKAKKSKTKYAEPIFVSQQ